MKNHTLMQTIARANRRFAGKEAGLIVDYVGVFRNLQRALAIYGSGAGVAVGEPIQNKAELVEHLRHLIAQVAAFCSARDIDLGAIKRAGGFEKVALLDAAVEALLEVQPDGPACR